MGLREICVMLGDAQGLNKVSETCGMTRGLGFKYVVPINGNQATLKRVATLQNPVFCIKKYFPLSVERLIKARKNNEAYRR